jgi:hypothetical protein
MTRTATLAGYIVLVAAAVALQIVARRRGTATFSDAAAAALRPPPLRLAVLATWLWLGWHLFVRVDW